MSSSSSSSSSSEIASAEDIGDALQRAQTALATMRARNHAGASGRWCRCDTARLHFFHHKGLPLIHRGQLDEMSDHWLMLEGPKEVTGVAKVTFDAWATKYYTRPRDGALAVTDDPNELKRLLESALASAHVHAQPQIPHGRPPTQREEYKITINFSNGRYLGKTLEQVGRMDHEGAAFLRWLAGYGSQPFSWHNTVDYVLLAQSFERLTKRAVAFETRGDGSSWIAKCKDGSRPPSAAPSLAPSSVGDGEVTRRLRSPKSSLLSTRDRARVEQRQRSHHRRGADDGQRARVSPAAQRASVYRKLRCRRGCDWAVAAAEGRRRSRHRRRRLPAVPCHAQQQEPLRAHEGRSRDRSGDPARHSSRHNSSYTNRHAAARSAPGIVVSAAL